MSESQIFYTQTMARIHARQGNLAQAAEIYRHLCRREPHRTDLAHERAEVEHRLSQTVDQRTVDLCTEWFDLIFALKKIRTLQRVRARWQRPEKRH